MLESIRKILILLLVGLVGPAFSVPFTFTYSGRLLDTTTGQPISGTRSIKITFWTAQTAGSQLAANAQTGVTNDTYSVSLTSGVFSQTINLSAANFHTVFPDTTTGTWVQVQDMTAGTTYPRQQYTTVPYALKVPVDGSTITYNSSGQLQLSSIGSSALPATINATTVTASSKMGIGTTTPSSLFEVLGGGAIASSALVSSTQTVGLFSNTDGTNARVGIAASGSAAVPVLDFRRTLGTAASPTAVTSGQNLGQMQWWGYDGTQIVDGGRIMVFSTENWTSTARGTDFRLRLNPTGSTTSTEVLRVTGDGNVGIGTSGPSTKLQVVDSSANLTASYARKDVPSTAPTTVNYVGQWSEANTQNNTGQLNALYGSVSRVNVPNTGTTLTSVVGSQGDLYNSADRPITWAYGNVGAVNNEGGGTITTAYSIFGRVMNTSGTITNGYGLYLGNIQATNKFGIYSADSTAQNVLLGNTGIGTSSPAAKLDVAGEVKFGNTSSTCNATNEGQQRYNSTSKQMEFCNGTAWMAYGASGDQIFTASGTFTVPTGVTTLRVEVWGGGGGGSCSAGDGTSGGTSSFGAYLSATGGGGATTGPGTNAYGGAGGVGSGGTINLTGGAGEGVTDVSGQGGGAPFGGAGGAPGCWGCTYNVKGSPGVVPGGGGGGAHYPNTSWGSGGGAGGYAFEEITGLTPGTAITVTVGAGGAAGNTTCASGGASGAVRVKW